MDIGDEQVRRRRTEWLSNFITERVLLFGGRAGDRFCMEEQAAKLIVWSLLLVAAIFIFEDGLGSCIGGSFVYRMACLSAASTPMRSNELLP